MFVPDIQTPYEATDAPSHQRSEYEEICLPDVKYEQHQFYCYYQQADLYEPSGGALFLWCELIVSHIFLLS